MFMLIDWSIKIPFIRITTNTWSAKSNAYAFLFVKVGDEPQMPMTDECPQLQLLHFLYHYLNKLKSFLFRISIP